MIAVKKYGFEKKSGFLRTKGLVQNMPRRSFVFKETDFFL